MRGRQAAVLVIGVMPMFLIAALVEGFLRQSGLSTAARFAFALLTAVFWTAFFVLGSRRRTTADSALASPDTD